MEPIRCIVKGSSALMIKYYRLATQVISLEPRMAINVTKPFQKDCSEGLAGILGAAADPSDRFT